VRLSGRGVALLAWDGTDLNAGAPEGRWARARPAQKWCKGVDFCCFRARCKAHQTADGVSFLGFCVAGDFLCVLFDGLDTHGWARVPPDVTPPPPHFRLFGTSKNAVRVRAHLLTGSAHVLRSVERPETFSACRLMASVSIYGRGVRPVSSHTVTRPCLMSHTKSE
jgi:hypothetical protein